MKILKGVVVFSVFLGIGLVIFVLTSWVQISSFPNVLPSYYAKEFCSCLYVLERDEKTCHDHARQWIPESDFKLDAQKKTVQVSALGATRTAGWFEGTEGCRLID